ncbi:MAG: type II secretion system protein, partial [Alphaproteobacteria bacterium]|nr:type II secretion system protein [Alphaproteobacteria bacterium]
MQTSKQSGRSMIEMLGVLAIVGILSITAIKSISKAMYKHKMNRETENIIHSIQTIYTIGLTEKTYTFVGNDRAEWQYDFPNPFNYNPWKQNLFGGRYKYNKTRAKDRDRWGSAFLFGLNNVDKTFCIELLTKDWNHLAGGLISIGISDNNEHMRIGGDINWCQKNQTPLLMNNDYYLICAAKIPLSPDKAAEVCTSSSKG